MNTRIAFALTLILVSAECLHAQVAEQAPENASSEAAQAALRENGPEDSRWGERWWVTGDYLVGLIQRRRLLPLVTTSPVGTAPGTAGELGRSSTTVLFGDAHVAGDVRSGFQVGAGAWLDGNRTLGVESGFFMMESQNALFFASSDTTPILARPFRDARTGAQDVQLVAFPGTFAGSIVASAQSNNLYGANLTFQEVVLAAPRLRMQSLLGYRFLHFEDSLNIHTDILSLGGGGTVAGTQFAVNDRFSARNTFHGVDIGCRTELGGARWSVALLTKVAVGSICRQIDISGNTQTTPPGGTTRDEAGGLLALSSNSGNHRSDDWVAVPQVGANLGWNVTNNVLVRFGYSLLYWSKVARASDQVDLDVNPDLFPTPAAGAAPRSPVFDLHRSDMWVQTLNVGLEFRY